MYEQILEELFSLQANQHIRPDLKPMQNAIKVFDNPHKGLEFIHITGTNGKGSTAAFLTSIFKNAGKRVATFTSPFLVDYRERITINNKPISKEEVVRYYQLIREKTPDLSFFEITTLIALLYFKQEQPDIVIWEVGLGGSFDATKVVEAKTAVITNVSLDHTNVLGKDKETIAKDKCGIINFNAIVFSAEGDPVIKNIIQKKAAKQSASVKFTQKTNLKIGLAGEHQKINAGLAVTIAKEFGINQEAIEKGLKNTSWPGRLQFIEKNVLLDCAHNPAGVQALANYLNSLDFKDLFVVMGVSNDKDLNEMVAPLPAYKELIFTGSSSFRAKKLSEVNIPCKKIVSPTDALSYAKEKAQKNDLIVVCGSIFLIGDVLKSYS